jgi:signal transduction histidine kinase
MATTMLLSPLNHHRPDCCRRVESSSRARIAELEAQVEPLKRQLANSQAENHSKDLTITSLKAQLEKEDEHHRRNENLQEKLNEYWKSRLPPAVKKNHPHALTNTVNNTNNSGFVRDVADEIQRWLFLEGGNLRDVESLLTEYSNFCRSMGMPLDRLFCGGMMLHPQMSAYVWKWEIGEDFVEHEIPHNAFGSDYNPDEPFHVLFEGRAMEYRMRPANDHSNTTIPPGCAWFTRDNYQDYLALPIYHRGEFKGAMAWSTKNSQGFSKEHIQIFHQSLAALSTVLRLHTDDKVMKTLMARLEEEVRNQTRELEQANTQLAQANRRVVSQSRAQLQHFAMMSHEIRTPLNGIVGISNLLLEEQMLPDQVEESIKMITSSGDLLLAVVDDVLDYSKLVTGKVEICLKPTRFRNCIESVLESFRMNKAQMRGLVLRTNTSRELPERIEMDGRRLQQILYNLLGNAVKFGTKGKFIDVAVTVIVDEDSTCQNNKYMKLSVKDYGKGIAPGETTKVFEPFQQASTNDPADGGTGLGLAITSQLVKVLGGTISVQSDYGKWCEFVVKLPLKVSPLLSSETEAMNVSSSRTILVDDSSSRSIGGDLETTNNYEVVVAVSSEPSPKRLRPSRVVGQPQTSSFEHVKILIAEDNVINQKVLQRTLNRIGMQDIDIVDNGQKAVEATERKVYDLVFMVRGLFVLSYDHESLCLIG